VEEAARGGDGSVVLKLETGNLKLGGEREEKVESEKLKVTLRSET